MPAVSEKQRKFFGAVYNCKKTGNCPTPQIKKIAKNMSTNKIKDFLRKENQSFISFQDYIMLRESSGACTCECSACKMKDCTKCNCENCECEGCNCKD